MANRTNTPRRGNRASASVTKNQGRPAPAGRSSTMEPPPADTIGEVRRSQLVGTWGPGAVIDLRLKSGAPVSGVVTGLEEWDKTAPPGSRGSNHPQVIFEARLQARLGKKAFRLPPVRGNQDKGDANTLPIARFPTLLQCPTCGRIARAASWGQNVGTPDRWCIPCELKENRKIAPVPVRFIVACDAGHLDEFPFQWWAQCKCKKPDLELETKGAGLAGKYVHCKACDARQSLEGAFGRDALERRKFSCKGHRPWLPGVPNEPCNRPPRVLQRGASNVYWSVSESALDIPPYSLDLEQIVGRVWPFFQDALEEKWPSKIDALELETSLKMTKEAILRLLKEWRDGANGAPDAPLLLREYLMFQKGMAEAQPKGQFDTVPERVPDEFRNHVAGVVAARRLREVRVLTGFTRIHPPSGSFAKGGQPSTPLAAAQQNLDWLPGIELRGEGIFIGLSAARVQKWESRADVQERHAALIESVKKDLREEEQLPDVTPRFVLLHSMAHCLMRQLSLECGYSSSALRERIYSSAAGPDEMLGLLIQTGSPDSEGTLGGLVRRARVDLFADTLISALRSQMWCSSDPLCITGVATLSSPRNGAACHACQLVPETSCTHFNLLLDRALLVGSDANPELGFFGAVIRTI